MCFPGKVFVHCAMGVSRSGALVLAYLMIFQDLLLVDAINAVRLNRDIGPNSGFLQQLRELELSLWPQRRQITEEDHTDTSSWWTHKHAVSPWLAPALFESTFSPTTTYFDKYKSHPMLIAWQMVVNANWSLHLFTYYKWLNIQLLLNVFCFLAFGLMSEFLFHILFRKVITVTTKSTFRRLQESNCVSRC